ncbi:DNA-3-methyladenine glycosylase family protein [Actinomadura craniellae]|uniref:DNA-3-methyladenine glycosylase family protein n=1 Tax=Actinomadura craniellae TaxID=2231787 RepID=UPI0018F242C2|nr:DNA-3-methyladenine glycosylase 2 family protein [Actinomadura craniellae]
MSVRVWRAPWTVDLRRVVDVHRRGPHDPAFTVAPDGAVWRASHTPDGPGTLRLRAREAEVEAAGYGPGGGWLLERVPALLGEGDDPAGLEPHHPAVKEAVRRQPGLRIGRTGRVWEALVPAVLEQKVVVEEAWRAWGYLLRRYGQPAPGAPDLRVPPPPGVWARIPSWAWHRSGAEAVRARTIMTAARLASRLETAETSAELDRRLRSIPGIGVWTSAETRQRALGDADAVSVGDYHVPGMVGQALIGRKVDDAGMLELLEPYAGHRYRVTRLLEAHGSRAPRRAPRLPIRDYRSF